MLKNKRSEILQSGQNCYVDNLRKKFLSMIYDISLLNLPIKSNKTHLKSYKLYIAKIMFCYSNLR